MNQETCPFPKKTLFFLIACLVTAVFLASGYSALSLMGKTAMNWPIFFGWFGVLHLFNISLFSFLRKNWALLNLNSKVGAILWGGLSTWYWSFGVFYFLLNMNLDNLQLKWTAIAFLWEIVVIGLFYVFLCVRLLRPIANFVDKKVTRLDPIFIYTATLKYPLKVAVLIFIISTFGYFVGSIQLFLFASLSLIELVKILLNGIAVALLLGVFFYLAVDSLMNDVRFKMAKESALKETPKRKIVQKIFAVSLAAVVGSVGLLSLIVLKSFQDVVAEHEFDEVNLVIKKHSQTWAGIEDKTERSKKIETDLKIGEQGKVFFLDRNERLSEAGFSAETADFVLNQESGRIQDLKTVPKMIVFFTEPTLDRKVVTVIHMEEFYRPLVKVTLILAGVAGLIIFFIAGVILLLSSLLSRSLKHLTVGVKRAEEGQQFTFEAGSADEIDELGNAFSLFIGQSQDLRANLEKQVAERTRQLEEKMEQSEKMNEVMIGRELKMAELKKENERLKAH